MIVQIKDLWQAKLLNKKDEFKDVESRLEEKIRALESDLNEKAQQVQDLREKDLNRADALEKAKKQLQ